MPAEPTPHAGVLSRNPTPGRICTLMPLVSSSSKEPISKASAALTSPRGGIRGGGYYESQQIGKARLPADLYTPRQQSIKRTQPGLQKTHAQKGQSTQRPTLPALISVGCLGDWSKAG